MSEGLGQPSPQVLCAAGIQLLTQLPRVASDGEGACRVGSGPVWKGGDLRRAKSLRAYCPQPRRTGVQVEATDIKGITRQ